MCPVLRALNTKLEIMSHNVGAIPSQKCMDKFSHILNLIYLPKFSDRQLLSELRNTLQKGIVSITSASSRYLRSLRSAPENLGRSET